MVKVLQKHRWSHNWPDTVLVSQFHRDYNFAGVKFVSILQVLLVGLGWRLNQTKKVEL